MSTNRDFTEMSGRSNEVNRPLTPQEEEEEREVVARERREMLGDVGEEASGTPTEQPTPHTGDPGGEDHATELEKESGERP